MTELPSIEIVEDVAIIIFPSRPYWFSATPEIATVLHALEERITPENAAHTISHDLDIEPSEALEIIQDVVDLLYSNSVLEIDGAIQDQGSVFEPHFQVNAVENVLVIAATQGCNLACQHCYANARKVLADEMKTNDIRVLVDELANMPWNNDVSRVGLTGGEFFMRPDAMELIAYIHSCGFRVLISTNALLLDDAKILALSRYPDIKVSVSLDGPTAESHEFIRGPGTFEKTIESMRNLADTGVFVGANMFIHAGNIDLIEETLALAESIGVKAFNCLNLMQVGRANSEQSKRNLCRIPENVLYHKLFNILRGSSRYQELMQNSTFANQVMGVAAGVKSHYCGIGTNRALYVRANGDIYPCPDTVLERFHLGNVREQRLEDIWKQSSTLAELRTLDVDTMNSTCAACDIRYFCGGGCRGENYQVTEQLRSPHFNCEEIRASILEIMHILTEAPDFLKDKVANLYQTVCI